MTSDTVTVPVIGGSVLVPLNWSEPGVRPTGLGCVRYEDLYKTGDTFNTAIARLGAGSKNAMPDGTGYITFPEGEFMFSDFHDPKAGTNPYGVYIPKNCKGFRGSGRGSLGVESGTIFTIKEMSSTVNSPLQGSGQSNQVTMFYRGTGSTLGGLPIIFDNFHIAGTNQGDVDGKCYHAFSLTNPEGPVLLADILTNGWYGDNGAPPGETFGPGLSDGHGVGGHQYLRLESDGRRELGGPNFGTVGFTAENWHDGTWTDCYAHHLQAAQAVIFQSSGVTTIDVDYGSRDGDSGTQQKAGMVPWALNHELAGNITHQNPRFNIGGGSKQKVNVTHSNGKFSSAYVPQIANGPLTIINPTFADIYGDGKIYLQSWAGEPGGNTQTTPPTVIRTDGSKIPGVWIDANNKRNPI